MAKNLPQDKSVTDVPADNPTGTMRRFTAGLKRVLTTPKPSRKQGKKRTKH